MSRFCTRRKACPEHRRLLKRARLGREFKELGALACALEDVKRAPRVPGYVQEPSAEFGVQTLRRVRRVRRERLLRVLRRFLVVAGVFVVVLVLLVGVVWVLAGL